MSSNFFINGVLVETMYGAKASSTAAATNIKVNGVDLNQIVLALADGQTGPTSNVESNGADLKTFFGIPITSLPINGGNYTGGLTIAGGTYTSRLSFNVSTSGWSLVGNTTESGSIPAGATQVECSFTQTAGNTTLTIVDIGQAAITSTTQTAYMQAQRAQSSPSTGDVATGVIKFYNASGTVISTTTFTGISQA